MIILSKNLVVDSFMKSLLLFICFFLVLLLCKRGGANKFVMKCYNFKKTSILIFALFLALTCFFVHLTYMKIRGQRDLAEMFKNMEASNKIDIELWGHSMDHREVPESLIIVDKLKIMQLIDFMKNLNYYLLPSKLTTETGERIEIKVWKKNNEIYELRIFLYLLETQKFQYQCSERTLFYKIIEVIKTKND